MRCRVDRTHAATTVPAPPLRHDRSALNVPPHANRTVVMGIIGDLAGLPSHPFESHGGSRAVLSQMLDGALPDRLSQLVVHALPGLIDGIGPHGIAQPDLMQEGAAAASCMILRPDRRTRRTLSALLTPRRPDCPKGGELRPDGGRGVSRHVRDPSLAPARTMAHRAADQLTP